MVLLTVSQAAAAQPVVDYMNIDAQINNGYAITTVEEKLTNQMDTAVYDDFTFLIPEEAFISGFSIIIDGKEYSADVLPKEQAAEKFEEAVSGEKTAGLMESKKDNMFSYALSFEPHQSIIVKLTYEQALKKRLGEYEYIQPMRSSHYINDMLVNVNITSVNKILSIDTPGFTDTGIKYISSNKGQVTYNSDSLPYSDLSVVFTTNNPPLNGNMLFYEEDGQGYMMHVFSPTEEDLGTTAMNKDIVFVIDKSGSMDGFKIAQVKRVFSDIISGLPSNDNFNVIFFDTSTHTYSNKIVSNKLMPADLTTKSDAVEFVNELDAGGGTNINDALLTSLDMFDEDSENVPIIVFLTDGDPTNGVRSPHVIRENVKAANEAQVSIFTIAFGIENEEYYDFLRGLSLENYGKAERFYPTDDSGEGISDFYQTISTPLITDMEFTYRDQVYEIVNTGESNLFAGSDAIVLGKCEPGTDVVTCDIKATTRTGSQDFTEQFMAEPSEENNFIPRLWAYTTINELMDRMKVEGENEELVSAITDLSMEYGFVTPYTSLFVELPEMTSTDAVDRVVSEEIVDEDTVDEAVVDVEEEIPTEEVASEPTDSVTEMIPTEEEAAEEPAAPGFEAGYAIAGMLAVACLILRRKN